MSLLSKLIGRKKKNTHIVWGIRAPESVKKTWLRLAVLMRVPANRLILFVLQDWARQNAEVLTEDEARNKLADIISEMYLQNGFL